MRRWAASLWSRHGTAYGQKTCIVLHRDACIVMAVFAQELQLYYNDRGMPSSAYDWAKSLCQWRNSTGLLPVRTRAAAPMVLNPNNAGFILPLPSNETVEACGETRHLSVYSVEVIYFEKAIKFEKDINKY